MSSVDGRLLNDRWTEPFDGTPASDLLQVYAAIGRGLGTDAWMFGKNTLRAAFSYKWGIDGHAVSSDSPTVFVGERRSERMFIATDPEADIFFTSSSLRGDNILVIVGRNAMEEYLAHLREKRISYVIVEDATDLREGLEAVGREFGIRRISVQGGGIALPFFFPNEQDGNMNTYGHLTTSNTVKDVVDHEAFAEDYSLWGGSAGARMAAYLGSYSTQGFIHATHERPAAVIMGYTGHSEYTQNDPPTYVIIGEDDAIASPATMHRRVENLQALGIDAEFHLLPDLRHGFGLGIGTTAEGWEKNAVRFWEKYISRKN